METPTKVEENSVMSKFKPGQTKPENSGRRKGSPNRKTTQLSVTLEALGQDIPTKIAELLPQLSAGRQVDVYLELMQYIYPKRKAMEISRPENEQASVVVYLPSNGREAPGTKYGVKPEEVSASEMTLPKGL
jgi:hypothetical protein